MIMENKPKLLLWGIGREYNRSLNLLKYWEGQGTIKIVGVTDKSIPEAAEIDGWKVYKTTELYRADMDYCLVMSDKYFFEVWEELQVLGVEKERILSSRILSIPYFSWDQYLKIYHSDLSIICNNCVGGILYHTLGLECKSPCKNLAIPDESFLKLIKNLEFYMSLELQFQRWQRDPHSREEFPVMGLDDVEIWCNHDVSADEARDKWNRRKEKINYENILLMMYAENDETGRRFLATGNQRKVLFVPETSRLEGDDVFQLKLFPGQKEFWETVNSSASLGKNSCNYKILDMLNGKRAYRNTTGEKPI